MSVAAPAAQANDIQNELANHLDVAERLDVEGSAPETGPDDVYGFDRNSVQCADIEEAFGVDYMMKETMKSNEIRKQQLIFNILSGIAMLISLLALSIFAYGVVIASSNGSLSYLGSSTSNADALGTLTTTAPPTSAPTAVIKRQDGTMSLDAKFSALVQFANTTNRSLESLAMDIIESALDLDVEDALSVEIIIHDVRSGSIIIEYTLRVLETEDADLLEVAVSNLEEAVGSEVEIEGDSQNETLSFPLTSNVIVAVTTTAAPSMSPTSSSETTSTEVITEGTHSPTTVSPSHPPTTSPSVNPTTAAPTESDIIYREDIIYHHIHRTNIIQYNYSGTFEEGDAGPYDRFNHSDPVIHTAGNRFYGWVYVEWRVVEYKVEEQGNTQTSDYQNLPLPDIHVKYGDKVEFWMAEDNRADDLLLVTKEMFESCNFSSIADDKDDVTNESAGASASGMWLTDKYGLYNFENASDWKPYTVEIVDRRNETNSSWNSLRDELLAGDILYFTSSRKWEREDQPQKQACKRGWKQRVIIEQEPRRTLPLIESNINALFDSDEIQDLVAATGHLGRTLVLKQFNTENRIRSEGDSGITNVRGTRDGTEDYDDGTYSNGNVLSIHNHANNIKVVGIGEIEAVLNGVEFKTRHNDYDLNMPHTNSSEYHATEPVPFPDVPPEVLAFGPDDVEGQIGEMQEWFRAFKWQNASHRNYTKYFKPILCYLEGTWIDEDDALTEPFESDRHHIDAKSWEELHNKVRFMSNSGRKNPNENLATLPSSIRNLVNDTYPIISNWEYRILCAPLKNDVETSRFRISDDLSVQLMGSPETRNELFYSRRARFDLNRNLEGTEWEKGRTRRNYLDVLMEQIPGKNNFGANLTDSFPDGTSIALHDDLSGPINTGYYSRFYRLSDPDAMGSSSHRRGFSDRYLFAAQTTHSKVSPIAFDYEVEHEDGSTSIWPTISRWSYAIPMEVIYLTPLTKWNPYNITLVEDSDDFVSGLSGQCGSEPLQNLKGNMFYWTPASFFGDDDESEADAADTAESGLCAIGADGEEHAVAASGHWITFPSIGGGVGMVRQRYPISPIHGAGSAAFKEVKALHDVVLPTDYDDVETGVEFFTDTRDLEYGFNLYLEGGGHDHLVFIKSNRVFKDWYDDENLQYLNGSDYLTKADSETANGHTHTINVWRWRADAESTWNYVLDSCRFGLKTDEDVGWTNDTCADFHDTVRRDTGEETQ